MGRLSTVAFQPLASFRVTFLPLDSVTSMNFGRLPSWLSASFQTFSTVTEVTQESFSTTS